MIHIFWTFISGMMVGIELLNAEDVGEKDPSFLFGIVIDIFIIRFGANFYRSDPVAPV